MRIITAEVTTLDLGPGDVRASWGEMRHRHVLRLRLVDEVGHEALGEAAPIDGYTEDDLAQASRELQGIADPSCPLLETPIEGPRDIETALDQLGLGPAAAHAVDQALLGLLARRAGCSVASLLGDTVLPGVASHALVGDTAQALAAVARGITALKVKLGTRTLTEDLTWLAELRTAIGAEPSLRADVNGAWSVAQAQEAWPALDELGVDLVEDPLPAACLDELRALREAVGPRVAIDQGCRDAGALERIIEAEAADVVVIKPMAVGGLLRARDLAHRAADAGLGVMITTCLESDLGRQGALAVARAVPGHALEVSGVDPVASVWPGSDRVSGKIPNPIASAAISHGADLALAVGATSRTWSEVAEAAAAVATQLERQGVRAGDVVALTGRPSARWIEALYGVSWLGAVAAPLATEPRSETLAAVEARFVLAWDDPQIPAGPWTALEDAPDGSTPVTPSLDWHLERPLIRLLTSGTTGHPVPVTLTAGQVLFGALGSSLRLGHLPGDRWLCCLPLHHVGGLSILLRAAITGAGVEVHSGFDPERVRRTLERGEVSLLSLVPEMLRRLLDVEPQPRWTSLRALLVGGAACDETLAQRARELGLPLALTWGMTETAAQVATALPGADPTHPLPPLAFVRVMEDGAGGLIVGGPQAGGRPVVSGDQGAVIGGRVRVDGRRDGVISSGALRLDPRKITDALLALDGVVEAAVASRADARWGERPVAALVAQGEPLDSAAVRRGLRERLKGPEIPDLWVWLEELPRGPLGKISGAHILEVVQEAEAGEPIPHGFGHRDGLEAREVHEGVDLPRGGAQRAVLGAADPEDEGDGALTERLDLHLDPEAVVEGHGALEIGVRVDERHAPSTLFEDARPGRVDGQEELLEGHVNVLEDTTVEGDAGAVDLVKSHGELVGERHVASSSIPSETPGVPDASSLEGT